MSRFDVNTYSYIWSMRAADCVRHLAGLGFRHFELLVQPPHVPLDDFDAAGRRDLRAAVAAVEGGSCALNLPSLDHNLASPFPRARAASVRMFMDTIDLAADIGAAWVVVVPGRLSPLSPPKPADSARWVTDGIQALLPHAESRGVRLALENVPFTPFPDAGSLGRFARGFNTPLLGVCYDVANAHFHGESPAEGIAQLTDLLRIVHLSDTGRTVWKHDRVGTGSVPFDEVIQALSRIGYDGHRVLEVIDRDPDNALLDSQRRLEALGGDAR